MNDKAVITHLYDLKIKDWLDFELYLFQEVKAGRLVEPQVDMHVQIMQSQIDKFLIRNGLITQATVGKDSATRYPLKFWYVVIPFEDDLFQDFLSIKLSLCSLGTINLILNYHEQNLKLIDFEKLEKLPLETLLEFYVVERIKGFDLIDGDQRIMCIHDWIYNKRESAHIGDRLIKHHYNVFMLSTTQIEATIELLSAYIEQHTQLEALSKILNNEVVEGYIDIKAAANIVVALFNDLALVNKEKLPPILKEKLIEKIVDHTRYYKKSVYDTFKTESVKAILNNKSKYPHSEKRIKTHTISSIK